MSILYEPLLPNHTRVAQISTDISGQLHITILLCRLVEKSDDGLWVNVGSHINGQEADFVALSYT